MAEHRSTVSDDIVSLVEQLLRRAIEQGASDVHFEPAGGELRVRYRLDGLLHDLDRLPGRLAEKVIARLKVLAGLLTYRTDVPQEGSFPTDRVCAGKPPVEEWPADLRVAVFPTIRGERAVVRILYTVGQVTGLGDLGLSDEVTAQLRRSAGQPHGLILVTGPAGSGKSTTLHALARHILDTTPGRSVVALEDPVEQRVDGLVQIQISPYGELNYARAMRSLLRQDVEVLLVGEVRDAETAHLLVQASLTGHLLMSTMHSGDPADAMARLLEMGIAPYQVVGALSVVCSQRLLRLVCTHCQGSGCDKCADSGYRGRTACGQVAVLDESLRRAIVEQRPAGDLRQLIQRQGPDLVAASQALVERKVTTIGEVRRVLGTLVDD